MWELICAGGAFRSWSVCTCTQHLLHLSPQWISLLFWKPGKNLSKACLNHEQHFTDTFPAVCPAFEEWCLLPGIPCVLSRSPQPSSRDISKGTSKWAATGSLCNPDSFTAVICPYPWSHVPGNLPCRPDATVCSVQKEEFLSWRTAISSEKTEETK